MTIEGSVSLDVTGGAELADNIKEAYGIYCSYSLIINGSVKAEAGTATDNSLGIQTESRAITVKDGGILNATGGTITGNRDSYGSYGIYTTGITVENGGIIETTGGAATGNGSKSYGVYGNGQNPAIAVKNGGILNATGGTAEGTGSNSYGAYVDFGLGQGIIVYQGGICNATGGIAPAGDSYGVYISGIDGNGITVKSGGKMNATGQAALNKSDGVYSNKDITVENGGTITSIAGTGKEAYGIEGNVTVDGILIAAGNKNAVRGTVKNSITGIGWTNTEGRKTIAVNTDPGWTLDYMRVQFPEF